MGDLDAPPALRVDRAAEGLTPTPVLDPVILWTSPDSVDT